MVQEDIQELKNLPVLGDLPSVTRIMCLIDVKGGWFLKMKFLSVNKSGQTSICEKK